MKLPNFTRPLYGIGEHSTKIFFFLTQIRSLQIQPQNISPTFDKLNEIGNIECIVIVCVCEIKKKNKQT